MKNKEFSPIAEIDGLLADFSKGIDEVWRKYGVRDQLVDQVLTGMIQLSKDASGQDNRPPDDGLDFSAPCKRQRMLPYEWRIDQELK